MARVAVLGEHRAVAGYALAGALVLPAETDADVHDGWSALPPDVAVVLLTARAAEALGGRLRDPGAPLTAVIR